MTSAADNMDDMALTYGGLSAHEWRVKASTASEDEARVFLHIADVLDDLESRLFEDPGNA